MHAAQRNFRAICSATHDVTIKPVALTVLLGFVVLLSIDHEAPLAILGGGLSLFRLDGAHWRLVWTGSQLLHDGLARLLAMIAFGVGLLSFLHAVGSLLALAHRCSPARRECLLSGILSCKLKKRQRARRLGNSNANEAIKLLSMPELLR
jgi:hypothetical protein